MIKKQREVAFEKMLDARNKVSEVAKAISQIKLNVRKRVSFENKKISLRFSNCGKVYLYEKDGNADVPFAHVKDGMLFIARKKRTKAPLALQKAVDSLKKDTIKSIFRAEGWMIDAEEKFHKARSAYVALDKKWSLYKFKNNILELE